MHKILTHVEALTAKCHPVSTSKSIVHPEERCEEPQGCLDCAESVISCVSCYFMLPYEDNRHDRECHDGLSLLDTLVRPVKCGFCFDYACLLLFE